MVVMLAVLMPMIGWLCRSLQMSCDGNDEADGDDDIDNDYVDYDGLTSATGLDMGGGGGYMPGE